MKETPLVTSERAQVSKRCCWNDRNDPRTPGHGAPSVQTCTEEEGPMAGGDGHRAVIIDRSCPAWMTEAPSSSSQRRDLTRPSQAVTA